MWTNPLIEHFITYLKISIYYYLFSSLSLGGMLVALTCEFILTFGRIFLILCRNEAFTRPSLKYFMHVSILFSSKSIAKLSVQLSPSIWFSFSSWSDLSMLSQVHYMDKRYLTVLRYFFDYSQLQIQCKIQNKTCFCVVIVFLITVWIRKCAVTNRYFTVLIL